MGEYDFTYQLPKNFHIRVVQYLEQFNQRSAAKAFQRCEYEYEDVGLANPNACMRTVAAFQAARTVGFPEARIPIASAIIDLCLSPKSKSSEAAIDAALASLRQQSLPAPEYLRLTPVGLEEDEKYNYDRPELWEYIQYLPDQIANNQFYVPWMTSQYEKALAENYRRILKHGRTSNIKKLNHTKKS